MARKRALGGASALRHNGGKRAHGLACISVGFFSTSSADGQPLSNALGPASAGQAVPL